MKKIRICGMAIIALVLLAITFVPTLFLKNGDRLIWQLSNWTWIFASLLIAIIGILSTIHYSKGKHILKKIISCIGCFVLIMACFISMYIAMVKHDEKIWSNKEYVIYSQYYDFFDPNMLVLYKRDGLIDRHMYRMNNIGFGELRGSYFSIYKEFDLIKEDLDVTEFESDSIYHCTVFYRLSDGYQFEQEKNDSLLEVIRH
jgi:hypothetical protein